MFSFQFQNPFWWIIPLFVLAGMLAYVLYWSKRKKDFTLQERRILTSIRVLALSILLFLLLKPLLFMNKAEEILPKLFIAVDASASMVTGKDSAWVQSELNKTLIKTKNQLGDKYDVQWLNFGARAQSDLPNAFSESESDISAAIRSVQEWQNPSEIAGLLIVSDGIYNKGVDPLYLANSLTFPVHTIAVGDSTRYPNLSVDEVFHNAFVYPDTEFEIEVFVEAYQAQGNVAELLILQNERVIKTEKIALNSRNQSINKRYMIPAGKAGLKKFSAKITTLNGEKNIRDNIFDFYVEVIDNQKKVLLIQENIHPDLGVLRNFFLESKNYKLFEISPNKLKDFKEKIDIVICHSPQSQEIANYFKNQNQAALLMIAGYGTQKSVANALLGFDLGNPAGRPNQAQWTNHPAFASFRINPLLNQIFEGNQAFDVYFNPQNIGDQWSMASKQKINAIELDRGLLWIENAQTKKAFLNGEGLYKWSMQSKLKYGKQDPVLEWINQLMQFLSTDQKRKNLDVKSKKEFFENEEILLDARLYDESNLPLANKTITLELSNEKGEVSNYNFTPYGESYQLSINDLPQGIYTYKAQSKVNNETYKDQGIFKVITLGKEKINTLAQHQLLANLSAQTQGIHHSKDDFENMIEGLKSAASEKSYVKFERKLIDLIELKSIFILILLFLTAEWALRRYFGNY